MRANVGICLTFYCLVHLAGANWVGEGGVKLVTGGSGGGKRVGFHPAARINKGIYSTDRQRGAD